MDLPITRPFIAEEFLKSRDRHDEFRLLIEELQGKNETNALVKDLKEPMYPTPYFISSLKLPFPNIISAPTHPKPYSDSQIKLDLQNLPVSEQYNCFDLKLAIGKRLRQRNTPIDLMDSPYTKLLYIYLLNIVAQGVFSVLLFAETTYEKIWNGLLSFLLVIILGYVAQLIKTHMKKKRELEYSWLKDLENNSSLVRHLSVFETDRAERIKKEQTRTLGFMFFFMVFFFSFFAIMIGCSVYPDLHRMALSTFPFCIMTIFSGVEGVVLHETDVKKKRRLELINSILVSISSCFIVYVIALAHSWSFNLSCGVAFVAFFTTGPLAYHLLCLQWQDEQETS